jgi:hypothetical protein
MIAFVVSLASTIVGLLVLCGVLHLLPRLGGAGKAFSAWLCRAPGLDVIVFCFTTVPIIVGPIMYGWAGLFGAVVGMYSALILWTILHELAHPEARNGPRIIKINNKMVGVIPNLLALFATSWAVPVFTMIRLAEYLAYPPLIWLANFPRYRHGDWVNVTRHKFSGLIGHDRIWCLYCDWMTGVWSLGGEMLRNVESFWCPIRFHDATKCDNCKHDFPDIHGGWVPFESDMKTVTDKLSEQYLSDPKPKANAWFGHPVRLTVKGKDVEA